MSLAQTLKSKLEAEEASASTEYAQILRRVKQPKDGDAARLIELASILQISKAQLSGEVAAAIQLAELDETEAGLPTAEQRAEDMKRFKQLEGEFQKVSEQVKELEAERDRLWNESRAILSSHVQQDNMRGINNRTRRDIFEALPRLKKAFG